MASDLEVDGIAALETGGAARKTGVGGVDDEGAGTGVTVGKDVGTTGAGDDTGFGKFEGEGGGTTGCDFGESKPVMPISAQGSDADILSSPSCSALIKSSSSLNLARS
jgi:hypothetical protein